MVPDRSIKRKPHFPSRVWLWLTLGLIAASALFVFTPNSYSLAVADRGSSLIPRADEPTGTDTPTLEPTDEPTPASTATDMPTGTSTFMPTATPTPTNTATPSPTPTASTTPTATPTPICASLEINQDEPLYILNDDLGIRLTNPSTYYSVTLTGATLSWLGSGVPATIWHDEATNQPSISFDSYRWNGVVIFNPANITLSSLGDSFSHSFSFVIAPLAAGYFQMDFVNNFGSYHHAADVQLSLTYQVGTLLCSATVRGRNGPIVEPDVPSVVSGPFSISATATDPDAAPPYLNVGQIDQVIFQIYGSDGTLHYSVTDYDTPYCINSDCAQINPAGTWPNGAPIVNGAYIVLVRARDDDPCNSCTRHPHWTQMRHYMTINALPTSTPTDTPTPTLTPTSTDTPTPTPTLTPTHTPDPDDPIFADDFDSGDLSVWSASVTNNGDLCLSQYSMLGQFALNAMIDDNHVLYVRDDTPDAEAHYRVRFYFAPRSITMTEGDTHNLLVGYTEALTPVLRIQLSYRNSGYQIGAGARNDRGGWRSTPWFGIEDSVHFIEVDWQAASTSDQHNGRLVLWLDGEQRVELAGINNDTRRIDSVRLGAVGGIDSGTRGGYDFDAFESRRHTYIGPIDLEPTETLEPTQTPEPTETPTPTPSRTPSMTPTRTVTITRTRTPTMTPSSTRTRTPTITPSLTRTRTPTRVPSPTWTTTPTLTPSPTSTATFTPTWGPSLTVTLMPEPTP